MTRKEFHKLVKSLHPCADGMRRLRAKKGTVLQVLKQYAKHERVWNPHKRGYKMNCDFCWLRNMVCWWRTTICKMIYKQMKRAKVI